MKHLLWIGKKLFSNNREYCIRMQFFEFLCTVWVYYTRPSKLILVRHLNFDDIFTPSWPIFKVNLYCLHLIGLLSGFNNDNCSLFR
jgi:hypothetical protein